MHRYILILFAVLMVTAPAFAQDISAESKMMVDRGWSLETQGRYDEAIDLYNQALEADPNNYIAHKHLGTVNCRMKNYAKAEEEFAKAVAINPSDASTYYNRGIMYYEQGEYDKSTADYSKALEINPQYQSASDNRLYADMLRGRKGKPPTDSEELRKVFTAGEKVPLGERLRNPAFQGIILFILVGILTVVSIWMKFSVMNFGPLPPPPAITAPQQDDVIKKFAFKQKYQRIIFWTLLLCAFSIFTYKKWTDITYNEFYPFVDSVLFVLAISMILNLMMWRCPWCNKFLGFRYRRYNNCCQHCGVKLQ